MNTGSAQGNWAMDASLLHEPRRRSFQLADGEMAAIDFGDPTRPVDILFCHANGFNALTYRSILAPLSASLRILALDQRGHGASRLPTATEGRASWDDMVGDLVQVIDQLDAPPLVLAGHSMGGSVSLLAAGLRPDRVRSLVLFDPVVMPWLWSFLAETPFTSLEALKKAPIAVRAAARRAIFPSAKDAFSAYHGRGAFKSWPDMILADYVAAGFHALPDGEVELACAPAWEASNFSAQKNRIWSRIGKVKASINLYRAEHGSTCRIGNGWWFFKGRRGVHQETVPGSSHFLPMERPDLVRDALIDAVEQG